MISILLPFKVYNDEMLIDPPMKKPVIAVDIDDVLVDTAAKLLDDYNRKYGTSLTKHHYYKKDVEPLGVTDYAIAAERLAKYHTSPDFLEAHPIPDAIDVIQRLSPHFEFIGVTSRPETIAEPTRAWAKQHFGDAISKIIFTSFVMAAEKDQTPLTKAIACKEIGAVFMIKDHLGHALPVSELGVKVFLIDQLWNQHDALPENVIRTSGWSDVEKHLLDHLAV
jgi:5'(3')-deoxyribonucleotidase